MDAALQLFGLKAVSIQELEILIQKTKITPASAHVLEIIKSELKAGNPVAIEVGAKKWSALVDTEVGIPVRFSFEITEKA